MHNIVESPICMRPERLSNPKHPAQKPVSILKKIIRIASNEGDIIFDPFMGVGSMGVAAIDLNRKFIGVEIEKIYFMAAKDRINNVLNCNIHNNMKDMREYNNEECEASLAVNDLEACYQQMVIDFDEPFANDKEYKNEQLCEVQPSGLSPIVKWPGGKEKELEYIIPNAPKFNRFFEPLLAVGLFLWVLRRKNTI